MSNETWNKLCDISEDLECQVEEFKDAVVEEIQVIKAKNKFFDLKASVDAYYQEILALEE